MTATPPTAATAAMPPIIAPLLFSPGPAVGAADDDLGARVGDDEPVVGAGVGDGGRGMGAGVGVGHLSGRQAFLPSRQQVYVPHDVLNVDPEQLPKVMQSLQSTPELELRAAWVPFELLSQSALKVAVMTGPVCGIAMTAAIRAAQARARIILQKCGVTGLLQF